MPVKKPIRKYTKKASRKTSRYPLYRSSFKAKSSGNYMLNQGQAPITYKQTAMVSLVNLPANNQAPAFIVSFLNNPAAPQNVQLITPQNNPAAFAQFGQFARVYDEFTCTGVRVKYFQIPNFGGNAYIFSECFQDDNTLWAPANPSTAPMAVYGNYQTIPLNANNVWTRYFSMDKLKKRLGISWCATSDAGYSYYGQLTANPCFVVRNNMVGVIAANTTYTRCEVTWYYQFRGLKPSNVN